MSVELWTDERDELLRKMRADRVSFKVIANAFEIDPETVSRRAQKLGLISLPISRSAAWPLDRDQQLITLWNTRPILSAAEIGDILGCTRNAIIGRAHRLRLAKRARSGPRAANAGKCRKMPIIQFPAPTLAYASIAVFRPKLPMRPKGIAPEPQQGTIPTIPEPYGPPLSLDLLRAHHCRWIDSNSLYCGAGKDRGSYCHHHAAIIHTEQTRTVRRRAT